MELFIQQVVLVFTGEWGTREKNVYDAQKGPVTYTARR